MDVLCDISLSEHRSRINKPNEEFKNFKLLKMLEIQFVHQKPANSIQIFSTPILKFMFKMYTILLLNVLFSEVGILMVFCYLVQQLLDHSPLATYLSVKWHIELPILSVPRDRIVDLPVQDFGPHILASKYPFRRDVRCSFTSFVDIL